MNYFVSGGATKSGGVLFYEIALFEKEKDNINAKRGLFIYIVFCYALVAEFDWVMGDFFLYVALLRSIVASLRFFLLSQFMNWLYGGRFALSDISHKSRSITSLFLMGKYCYLCG